MKNHTVLECQPSKDPCDKVDWHISQRTASGLTWEFQQLDNSTEISDELLDQLFQVCVDSFGFTSDDWMTDNQEKLATSTLLGKLMDNHGQLYGIAFYSTPDETLDGSYILWEDGICLVKSVQRQGYSQKAIAQVTRLFPERQFNWLGCRTQNLAMMMRYSKLGHLFPFDELYDSSHGQIVMDFLLKHIAEVQTVHEHGKLNLVNGVCTQVYSQGRLGDYRVDVAKAAPFETQLHHWGFRRDQGDAVILVSSLASALITSQFDNTDSNKLRNTSILCRGAWRCAPTVSGAIVN